MYYKVEVKETNLQYNGVTEGMAISKLKGIGISITPKPNENIISFLRDNSTKESLWYNKSIKGKNDGLNNMIDQIVQLLEDNDSHSFDLV